jgi:hypothetical protein
VAGLEDTTELLGIDVHELARTLALVAMISARRERTCS